MLMALIVLTACTPAATPTPTLTPEPPTPLPPTATLAPAATVAARPAGESIFPAITAGDWQVGPANARITIIEYSDFQ